MNWIIWKDIPGYEKLYQVSSDGQVKRLERYQEITSENQYGEYVTKRFYPEMYLKPALGLDGYYYVNLYKNRKKKLFKIHRLVGENFLTTISGKNQINHIDGNKLNNHYSNLEWVTPKENTRHAINTGLRDTKGENNVRARLTEKDVISIRHRKKLGQSREDVYIDYKHIVADGTFKQVWWNQSWKHVLV